MKQSLHDTIRLLEKKKASARKRYLDQTRRFKAGLPIKVLPQRHLDRYNELDREIHELKMKR